MEKLSTCVKKIIQSLCDMSAKTTHSSQLRETFLSSPRVLATFLSSPRVLAKMVTSSKNSSSVWLNSREILNNSFIHSFSLERHFLSLG